MILNSAQSQFKNQWADGFQVLHPGKTMVGRAFTVQFMPSRADLTKVAADNARAAGITRFNNQTAIDMLQPGDVLVVDLGGKIAGGTMVEWMFGFPSWAWLLAAAAAAMGVYWTRRTRLRAAVSAPAPVIER